MAGLVMPQGGMPPLPPLPPPPPLPPRNVIPPAPRPMPLQHLMPCPPLGPGLVILSGRILKTPPVLKTTTVPPLSGAQILQGPSLKLQSVLNRRFNTPAVTSNGEENVLRTALFMDEALLRKFSQYLPTWTIDGAREMFPHPVARVEREIAELQVFSYIWNIERHNWIRRPKIVDIGATMSRHQKHKRQNWCDVHGCNPILTPADVHRGHFQPTIGLTQCQHTVNSCNCMIPDYYTSIHSLYYLTPEEILQLVNKSRSNTLVAAIHAYTEPYGTKSLGDQVYRVDSKGIVTASLQGNQNAYQHSALDWIRKSNYYSLNSMAMSWTVDTCVGDTLIYVFKIAPLGLHCDPPNAPVDIGSVLHNSNYCGPVNLQPITLSGTNVPAVQPTYARYGSFYCPTSPWGIPSLLVSQLIAQFTNRPRTPETFQTMTAAAKTLIKQMNVPADILPAVVSDAVNVAFTYPLQSQSRQTFRTFFLNSLGIKFWNRTIAMETSFMDAIYHYPLLALLVAGILYYAGPAPWWWAAKTTAKLAWYTKPSWMTSIGTALLGVVSWLNPMKWLPGDLFGRFSKYRYEQRSAKDLCYEQTPILPQHPKALLTKSDNTSCIAKHGVTLVGIGFNQRTPVQARSCSHNEEIAMRNRVLLDMDVKVPDDWVPSTRKKGDPRELFVAEQWEKVEEFVEDNSEELFSMMEPVPPTPFLQWVRRFPAARQLELLEARETQLVGDGPAYNLCKSFIKREFLFKYDDLGAYDMTPRLIQSRGPVYQVHTGPWTHAFSTHLKKMWCKDSDSHIFYMSGYTAEALGELFEYCKNTIIDRWGSCHTYEDDGSTWDGSLEKPAIALELNIYDWFKPPPHTRRALRKQLTFLSVTRHGHYARHEGRRKTGDGNTSCGNSLLNALAHDYAMWSVTKHLFRDYQDYKRHLFIWVLGDDNLMFADPIFTPYMKQVETMVRDLAIRPKMKINLDPNMSEFCSGYFYPTPSGRCYGPKIGRALTKHGWSRELWNLDLQWLLGVAECVDLDWNHVPILRSLSSKEIALVNATGIRQARYCKDDEMKIHVSHRQQLSPAVYDFMLAKYGVDQSYCDKLEETINGVRTLPCTIHDPMFDVFFDVDVPSRKVGATTNNDTTTFLQPLYDKWLSPTTSCARVIIEEIFKRVVHPLPIPILEWIMNPTIKYFPTFLMHYCTYLMPLWLGILVHSCWNIVAEQDVPKMVLDHRPYAENIIAGDLWGTIKIRSLLFFRFLKRNMDVIPPVISATMPPVSRKARNVINRLLANKQLSESGLKWLVNATDPFHDSEVACDGYPDITSTRSLVQCITLSTTCTNTTATPGPWDLHLFLNPNSWPFGRNTAGAFNDNGFYWNNMQWDGTLSGNSAAFPVLLVSGFNAISTVEGIAWDAAGAAQVSSTASLSLALPSIYQTGNWRLVAAGFEAVDVTSELNKQGSVTAYRSPALAQNCTIRTVGKTNTYTATLSQLPPTSQAAATLYPNSRTWAAKDGVYSVSTLNNIANPFINPQPGFAGLALSGSNTNLILNTLREVFVPNPTDTAVGNPNNTAIPYDINGCVFSGLNPASQITVTVRYFVERIPTAAQSDLIVLARPSPQYDPLALEIYSRVLDELPVAVKVDENPLGEWFSSILEVIGDAAPVVASFIPGGGAIGAAVGAGAKALARATREKPAELSKASADWGPDMMPAPTSKQRTRKRRKRAVNPQIKPPVRRRRNR